MSPRLSLLSAVGCVSPCLSPCLSPCQQWAACHPVRASLTQVVVESTYTTLTIREVYAEHVGTYVVVARNVGGETRTSCQLTVAGLHSSRRDAQPVAAPAPATAAAPVATGPAAVTPCFTQPLQNKDVTEGKKARLDCIIVGQPEPEVSLCFDCTFFRGLTSTRAAFFRVTQADKCSTFTSSGAAMSLQVIWFHNDRPVKESLDFQLLFEGDRCSLVIREVYLEDSGDYRCLARNKHGMAESRARLVVEGQRLGANDLGHFGWLVAPTRMVCWPNVFVPTNTGKFSNLVCLKKMLPSSPPCLPPSLPPSLCPSLLPPSLLPPSLPLPPSLCNTFPFPHSSQWAERRLCYGNRHRRRGAQVHPAAEGHRSQRGWEGALRLSRHRPPHPASEVVPWPAADHQLVGLPGETFWPFPV